MNRMAHETPDPVLMDKVLRQQFQPDRTGEVLQDGEELISRVVLAVRNYAKNAPAGSSVSEAYDWKNGYSALANRYEAARIPMQAIGEAAKAAAESLAQAAKNKARLAELRERQKTSRGPNSL